MCLACGRKDNPPLDVLQRPVSRLMLVSGCVHHILPCSVTLTWITLSMNSWKLAWMLSLVKNYTVFHRKSLVGSHREIDRMLLVYLSIHLVLVRTKPIS